MKNKPYYGAFFWIAVCSFIVPLFVAYRAFDQLQPSTKPQPNPDVSGVDHNLWDYLLKNYVADGLVDYNKMSRDYLFWEYIKQIGAADPGKLENRADKLALHCNAYNALVIKSVINHEIETSVIEFESNDKGFFQIKEHLFAGTTMSLDQLEKEIILPVFQEPRVHVALVCAAISCPPLRGEAYVGERLESQLQDQSNLFANDPRFVSYDEKRNVVRLSKILQWYKPDFDAVGGVFEWLAERVNDEQLRSKILQAKSGMLEVEYNQYDWALNSKGPTKPSNSSAGDFGSASVPNQ